MIALKDKFISNLFVKFPEVETEVLSEKRGKFTIEKVIDYIVNFLENDNITPSKQGKKIFVYNALKRESGFLPAGLQYEVDNQRNGKSFYEWCYSHLVFECRIDNKYFL